MVPQTKKAAAAAAAALAAAAAAAAAIAGGGSSSAEAVDLQRLQVLGPFVPVVYFIPIFPASRSGRDGPAVQDAGCDSGSGNGSGSGSGSGSSGAPFRV
jgi:hypothetical protein